MIRKSDKSDLKSETDPLLPQQIKVAIIIPRVDQLGPIKFVQSLVNRLCGIENLQIRVFYIDKIVDPHIKIVVPVERLNRRKFSFSDYDVIHTNGIRPDLFAFNNRKKIRYHISTIHNLVFEDLAFTYNRLISLIFSNIWILLWSRADKLVCVSYTAKRYYQKYFPVSKLEVVYNGIASPEHYYATDSDVIKGIKNFRSKGLIIMGAAGILTRRKGIDQILYLAAEVKELAVVVLGEGKDLPSLKNIAVKLNIADRCLFCGFVTNAVSYFKHFDIFIMPSKSEGFGLAMIEAVQQKISVICSDIDVFRELFNNHEVTYFKLGNLSSLTDSLHVAIKTGKMKTESAYIRYLNNYTDQLMAKRYYDIYRSSLT